MTGQSNAEPTRSLADLQQMTDAPLDTFSQGEWCSAVNDAVQIIQAIQQAVDWSDEDIERLARGFRPGTCGWARDVLDHFINADRGEVE